MRGKLIAVCRQIVEVTYNYAPREADPQRQRTVTCSLRPHAHSWKPSRVRRSKTADSSLQVIDLVHDGAQVLAALLAPQYEVDV